MNDLEEKLTWLRQRPVQRAALPSRPLTPEQWRSLILSQIRVDPQSLVRVPDVAVWAIITSVDLDAIEAIIEAIAKFGVVDDDGTDGSGGSGDGEDVGKRGVWDQDRAAPSHESGIS